MATYSVSLHWHVAHAALLSTHTVTSADIQDCINMTRTSHGHITP